MELIAHRLGGRGAGSDAAAQVRAALASGADRIELDVLSLDGRLVVAHDTAAVARGPKLSFQAALALVAAADAALLADVKNAAAATALGAALAGAGYGPRTILSGELAVVDAVARACGAQRAWTLPAARGCEPPAHAGPLGIATAAARARVRDAAAAALARGHCDAVAVDRRFVTVELVRDVHGAGGRIIVWTVDRGAELRRLERIGVDAAVTNDPARARRILSAAARSVAV